MAAGHLAGWVAGSAALMAIAASPARADSVPFYGYSDYFGGPATYYTRDTDVQQVTVPRDGVFGFGIRTYTRGGPFWYRRPAKLRQTLGGSRRYYRRSVVVRARG